MTRITVIACVLLVIAGLAQAQPAATGTTTLSLTVPPEAALQITSPTALATAASDFSLPFTGTTSFTYFVRTNQSGGHATITAQVTTDFPGGGGPSVATPPTSGDALTYTCAVASPGTGCSTTQTASTTASTNVANFGANAKSAKAGNNGSVSWSLTDDPAYTQGSYTATVTFTISLT